MRILLVEDDKLLGDGLCTGLKQAGFNVDWLKDGLSAQGYLPYEHFDLLILDLGLPKLSGEDLLLDLRQKGMILPVIILTARDQIEKKITLLNQGADDYLVKPIDLQELIARIRALVRRSHGRAQEIITQGDLVLNINAHTVFLADQVLKLAPKEFAILHILMERQGEVVRKELLQQSLYALGEEPESNVLEVLIHSLRQKLGKERIATLRGVGYIITDRSSHLS